MILQADPVVDTTDATRLLVARDVFRPSSDIGTAEWSIRYVFNEQGRAFDHMAFPHMVAVGGPMDSFDAFWIREVVMQFASRLGKTFAAFCAELRLCDLAPGESMNAGPQMELAITNANRVKKMIKQIPHLAEKLPKVSKQARLEFGANIIHTAWARSPATLSDRNIQFGAANEFDLWEHLETKDAPDPEKMFLDRFKDNWTTRKTAFESIPMIKGRSRVERRRLIGSNCRLNVECQHCGRFQPLETEHVTADGYVCPHCDCVNDEHDRLKMLRRCVWVPEGCGVDDEKAQVAADRRLKILNTLAALDVDDPACVPLRKELRWNGWEHADHITGTPIRDGEVASFQLSSMHALKLTWKEYHSQNDGSQNFINQWEGKTFEIEDDDDEVDLEELASDIARGAHIADSAEVPDWGSIITFAGDRQLYDYPWLIVAWSDDLKRLRIIDAGRSPEIEELELISSRQFSVDRRTRKINVSVCDSGGFDTDTVYEWARNLRRRQKIISYPVKGSSSALDHDYKLNPIADTKGRKRRRSKLKLCLVNTNSTQHWANKAIRKVEFAEAIDYRIPDRFLSREFNPKLVPAGPESIVLELVNDQPKHSFKTGNQTWDRIDTRIPNDLRDCLRYAYVAAQIEKSRRGRREPDRGRETLAEESGRAVDSRLTLVGPGDLEAIVRALNNE